jgi:hypothetical protein
MSETLGNGQQHGLPLFHDFRAYAVARKDGYFYFHCRN